ncbi:MAG: hypothetical protein AAGM36_08395 [Cyanobacteria bacterium J06597_1]
MSSAVYIVLLIPSLILSVVALVINCFYGLYVLAQAVSYRQFMLMFVSAINLLLWGGISFAAIFVFYVSDLFELLPAKLAIILLYLLISIVVFWGFRLLDKSIL